MKASMTETSAFRTAAPGSGGAAPRRGVRRETREITLIVAAFVVLLAVGAINMIICIFIYMHHTFTTVKY